MAYATGTGATGLDFLDAVRSFAVGLGWTAAKWDTTNGLLYISKGLCRLSLQYYTANITTYQGTTSVPITEGRIRGQLSQSFVTGTDWYNAPGGAVAPSITGRDNGPAILMGNMQGPFVQWFLFSNATGDYIHAMVQTTADTYTFFGFGNGDKGGLTHSGVAYAFSEGGRSWFRSQPQNSTYPTTSTQIYYNKPGRMATAFGSSPDRFTTAAYQIYTENALPAGFTNSVAVASYYSSTTFSRSGQTAHILKNYNNDYDLDTSYPTNIAVGGKLLDNIITMSQPGYTSFVPMLGIPLIVTNAGFTLACAIGSIPDLRVVNITGMSPQQELSLGSDVWKVFPQLRQTAWADGRINEAPSSGQFGLAFKKIV